MMTNHNEGKCTELLKCVEIAVSVILKKGATWAGRL